MILSCRKHLLAQDDISRQNYQFQNVIAQKVNAIIVVTASTLAMPKMTQLATAASLPLVDVTHPPAKHKRPPKVVFVGSTDVDSGTLQTQEVCGLLSGKGLMTRWITVGIPVDAVITNNDEMAVGAIPSLKAARKVNQVMLARVDATPDALAAMKAGGLKVTVFQSAHGQGRGAVDAALKLVKGQVVPFELVTPANMGQDLKKN